MVHCYITSIITAPVALSMILNHYIYVPPVTA